MLVAGRIINPAEQLKYMACAKYGDHALACHATAVALQTMFYATTDCLRGVLESQTKVWALCVSL